MHIRLVFSRSEGHCFFFFSFEISGFYLETKITYQCFRAPYSDGNLLSCGVEIGKGKIVINYDTTSSVRVLNVVFSRDTFMHSCLKEICFLHPFLNFKFVQGKSLVVRTESLIICLVGTLIPNLKLLFYFSVTGLNLLECLVNNAHLSFYYILWFALLASTILISVISMRFIYPETPRESDGIYISMHVDAFHRLLCHSADE